MAVGILPVGGPAALLAFQQRSRLVRDGFKGRGELDLPDIAVRVQAGYAPIADPIFLQTAASYDAEIGFAQVLHVDDSKGVTRLHTILQRDACAVPVDFHRVGFFRKSPFGSPKRRNATGNREENSLRISLLLNTAE